MFTESITDTANNTPPSLPPNTFPVNTWRDRSGNGNTLTRAGTQGVSFKYVGCNFYPNINTVSNYGSPFITLNRPTLTNQYIGCNISLFAVISFSITNTTTSLVFGNDCVVNYNNNSVRFYRDGTNPVLNQNTYILSAPLASNTQVLVSVLVNGSTTTVGSVLPSTNLINLNGAFVSSSISVGSNFNTTGVSFFSAYGGQQGNNPGVSISEVLFFYRTLTSPERFAIESQLIKKWGLPSNAPVSFINSLPVTSGLYGWYDAYDQTTVLRNASNNVSMWLDKSGQSNHMSTVLCTYGSNTGSNLYYSSINVSTNSFSALFFPSTFAVMRTSTLVVNQSFSTFSMISVGNFFKSNAGPAPRNVSLYSTLVANDMAFTGSVLNSAGGVNVTNTNFTTRFSTLHINTMLVNLGPTTDTGIATGNALTYFNGVSNQTTTGLTYTGMIQPSYISLMGSGLTNSAGEGDFRNNSGSLAEVLLYNRILTSTELTNTHNYLLNKYGISNTICNVPVTSGLNLWLDAYDPSCVITDSNSNVLLWRDKSGLSNHFSNFTTNFPILTRNPQVNAPSISFNSNAITQALVNSNFNISSISSFSIVGVSLLSNTTVNGRIFSIISTSQTLDFQNDNGFNIFNNNGTGFGYTRSTVILSNTVSSNINNMFSLIVNNSTIINDVNPSTTGFGTNGIMRSFSTTTTTSTLNVNLAYIGTSRNNDATSKFSGLMCELLYYNRVLSFPERQQVESYLMSKWNV
jgi:hypothetical protein